MPIHKQPWAIAALFLVAFCGLGFAAVNIGALLKGIEMDLPVATRFDIAYGPIAFPLFGLVAGTTFILSDGHCRKPFLVLSNSNTFRLVA